MYKKDTDVDKGLFKGQTWPSKPHKALAQNLILYNIKVTAPTQIKEIVQKIIKIPKPDLFESYRALVSKYNIPYVHGLT